MSKPRVLFCLAMAAVALSVSPVRVMAVPACPGPAQVTQPDGTPITVYLRGDEYAHWNESSDGYHITRNDRHEWVYMVSDNGRAVASEHAVGKADPHAVGALKPDKAALSQRGRQSRALRADAEETPESTQAPAAQQAPALTQTTGTMYNLVVLVNFSDLTVAYPTQDYDDLFNQVDYTADGAVGSVKDYYHEISYDALTVQSVVPEPVTLANGYAYYGANSPVTGNDLRPREMVAEALAALEARGFDFTSVDGDSDGEIDGLTIIHAGGGEEYSGNDEDYIWSHQWALISPVTYDGVTMYTYHTEPARRGWDSSPSTQGITRIGVICHENGHFLGLPDLYDYGYDSEGAGDFCLMAGGSWNGSYGTTPAHMSAWCKSELTWITPTVVSVDGPYSLGQVETNAQAYKLQGPFPSTQYFLVENRQGVGFDAGLPGPLRGILIWHVDETQPDNDDQTHYLVDLEEAGGTQHLELNQNEGQDSDYFRTGNAIVFSDTSTPNNLSYTGQPLGLNISNVSATGTVMSFTVGNPPAPPAAANVNQITVLDTPVEITLDAADEGLPNPPGALSCIITTLPSHGTLSDPSAGAISSVPYTLTGNGNQVTYTPDSGYGGPDSFQYKANDGGTPPDGGDSNTATVSIDVRVLIYSANMDIDPGWTYDGNKFEWRWGVPVGSGGDYGNPDPTSGYTGSNVVGYDLTGDYGTLSTIKWTTTGAIDCTDQTGVTLSFYRWLNVEGPAYDHAYIQVSNNGSSWSTIWENTSEITDASWIEQHFDISAMADNQPTVYIRWGMGPTDAQWYYSGWNIDDVLITGIAPITQYTLTVSSASGGSVSTPGEGAFQYDQGTVVDVNAVPELHYHFVDWTGTAVDAGKVANPAAAVTTVTVDSDYTLAANFAIDTFTLDYAAGPGGTLTGDTYQVVDFNSTGTPVTAVPDTGYHFVDWSDTSTDNPRTDADVTANISVTANFAIDQVAISGFITEPDPNYPIAGVSIESAGEPNVITDPNGYYAFIVDYGWSGVIEPNKTGYTFEPNSITYENTPGDPNSNYTAILDTFIISGYALDAGTLDPLDGVLLSPDNDGGPFTSKYYGGGDVTDANGFYEVRVDYSFSGDVVPSKYAYAFEPNGITYTHVTGHIAEPNHYAGTLLTYTITGYIKNACEVPIQDVLVQASSGGTSDTTDPNGYYEVWVDYNFSGTLTPAKQNYTFDPNTAAYANVLSDWMDENYLAANIYDLDCDGSIAIGDLAILTGHWLQTGPDVPGDFHKDPNDIVNFPDFAVFADVWGNE
ncbi:MAG: M6 family metalloprotease domain-containing protein [Phycisphaerae bacterium]|nr:M6 family metalloprotease domain-containing protein [Phycisphaerae bacterium]